MNQISTALTSVTTSMTEVINIGNVAILVGAVLSAGVVLYFGWFGIRKVISAVTSAAKGRLRV